MQDLHALTRSQSTENVAKSLGMTVRCLGDKRRGKTPLTVDDLFELLHSFSDFDLLGTVQRIGAKRKAKGWNKKHK